MTSDTILLSYISSVAILGGDGLGNCLTLCPSQLCA